MCDDILVVHGGVSFWLWNRKIPRAGCRGAGKWLLDCEVVDQRADEINGKSTYLLYILYEFDRVKIADVGKTC